MDTSLPAGAPQRFALTEEQGAIRDMAREATGALLALIEHEETVPHQMLPFQLVVRGSTGPAT